jgi:hypothetical protein
VLWSVLTLGSETAAQEVTINGLVARGASTTLNITVDVIEYRQGTEANDARVHLTTGKRHFGLAVVSPIPLPQLDTELLLPPMAEHPFSVSSEDGREFTGCLVTGLKSGGAETALRFSYALACESMSLPPLQCTNGCQGAS